MEHHRYTTDLPDSEVYSYDVPWQYGDEASLYSIAEDSREGITSTVTPSVASRSSAVLGMEASVLPFSEFEGGIELCVDDDEDLSRASDSDIRYYDQNRRQCRCAYIAIAICALLVGAVVALTLSHVDQIGEESSFSDISEGEGEGGSIPRDISVFESTNAPSLSPQDSPTAFPTRNPTQDPTRVPTTAPTGSPLPPSLSPTAAPTEDTRYILSKTIVSSAISKCPGAAGTIVEDTSTPQGLVHAYLVQQVYDTSTRNDFGEVFFDPRFSDDYLREAYALSLLYISTNGDSWSNSDNWMSTSDPCTWNGVVCANDRVVGSCAVSALELDSNGMSGELPGELCCMPCVEHIGMANNQIGGATSVCLVQIPTLSTIDFNNNAFSAIGTGGKEKSATPFAWVSFTGKDP